MRYRIPIPELPERHLAGYDAGQPQQQEGWNDAQPEGGL